MSERRDVETRHVASLRGETFRGYRAQSTRLRHWDYASSGTYFVTLCAHGRARFFGDILDGELLLSPIGITAGLFWLEIAEHQVHAAPSEFVVMPNHIHGIVTLRPVETRHVASLPTTNRFGPLIPGSLPAIVHGYKAAVTRWARSHGDDDFAWQPGYYEHVVRDEQSLHRIREYIAANPARWPEDEENPERV